MQVTLDASQRARELFSTGGFYWAESVLLAVAEHEHIQSEIIPRIATGFCGGLAHTAGMCGAVSGGIMAISLMMGRNSPSDQNELCYEAVQSFMKRFSAEFNELNCEKLTGVHLGTAEGQALYEERGQVIQCTNYVGEAVRMVLQVVEGKRLTGSRG